MLRSSFASVMATILLLNVSSSALAEVFKFVDEEGRTHYVDSADKIPEKYREQLKEQPDFPELSKVSAPAETDNSVKSGDAATVSAPTVDSNTVDSNNVSTPDAAKVELFVADWCSHCRALETTLQAEGISYERFDIEKSPVGKRVYGELGRGGIPIARIAGRTIIRGNNPSQIKEALKQPG